MADETAKWGSPHGHSIANHITDKMPQVAARKPEAANVALDAYNKGVADTKKAVSDKIAEMALYFDKWECYSGKYSSSSARESVSPEELGEIITEVDVVPTAALQTPASDGVLEALKSIIFDIECLEPIKKMHLEDAYKAISLAENVSCENLSNVNDLKTVRDALTSAIKRLETIKETFPAISVDSDIKIYREACFKLSQDITLATESEQLKDEVRQLKLACEIHEHNNEQLRKERDELARALEDILHSAFEHGSQNLSGKTLDPDGEMLWKAKQLIKKIRGAKDEIR
jgi:hypothetical protein